MVLVPREQSSINKIEITEVFDSSLKVFIHHFPDMADVLEMIAR